MSGATDLAHLLPTQGRPGLDDLESVQVAARPRVPLDALVEGDSPRANGLDHRHVATLVGLLEEAPSGEEPWPPIVVHRASGQVVDGCHRLAAARACGRRDVTVEFFDGSLEDAYLEAVTRNSNHGLPLSAAERRAAARRVLLTHPHLSDREIARKVGIAAKGVAALRASRGSTAANNDERRVGADGRSYPRDRRVLRERALKYIADHPAAPLREVGAAVGLAPSTIAALKKVDETSAGSSEAVVSADHRGLTAPCSPAQRRVILDSLARDPSLARTQAGRQVMRAFHEGFSAQEQLAQNLSKMPTHQYDRLIILMSDLARSCEALASSLRVNGSR